MVQVHYSRYDDEGFMLMTLRQYVEGLPLYKTTYTEYGPFYYVLFGSLFGFAGVTHDAIRVTTVLAWVLVATGWAACVWRWRGSFVWTLIAFLTTVRVLRALETEPGHPQILVLLLYAAIFVAASFHTAAPAFAFATIGAASAAMLLTKINIGGFIVAALVAVFVACLRPASRPRALDLGVRALCLLMPTVLMFARLNNPIVLMRCAIYTFGIWAVLDALRRNATPDLDWSAFRWAAAGFVTTVLLTLGITLLQGTSMTGLFDGLILQPSRFGAAVPFQPPSRVLELYLDALCCAAGAAVWLYQRFRHGVPRYFQPAAALAVIVAAITIPRLATVMAPGLMWMFVPTAGGRLWRPAARVPIFVVCVAATFGILMVYPVPFTQSKIAASIVVLAALAALIHSLDHLLEASASRLRFAVTERMLCGAILSVLLCLGTWHVANALNQPGQATSHMPHSRLVQLSTDSYATYSDITARVSARCDTLATIPGMNSFNIWTNLPHPNGAVVSSAMVMFDEPAQRRLVKDFLAARHPCVIVNPGLVSWSARFRPQRRHQPFLELVDHELVRVYQRGGYEIRVPRSQEPQWH
jgi:hypothetical protein